MQSALEERVEGGPWKNGVTTPSGASTVFADKGLAQNRRKSRDQSGNSDRSTNGYAVS